MSLVNHQILLASRPAADLRSTAKLFLFRLYVGKKPAPDATSLRV